MQVLLIGSGGREHALAWRLAQSPSVTGLHVAPGSEAIAEERLAANGAAVTCAPVAPDDLESIERLAREQGAELVVIGPEGPLAAGLADRLTAAGFAVFGPSAAAARLETSKAFAKDFMARHAIPTAAYGVFEDTAAAKAFLNKLRAPFVIKASGLASGKGVVIAETRAQADAAVDAMLAGQFGAASAQIVIEEFMQGEEASIFAIVARGASARHGWTTLAACQDHKRAYDGDQGPNTGGMGAYAPAPLVTPALQDEIDRTIIAPTLAGMAAEGAPFVGVLYVGVMIGPEGPKVVEYNVRFGDPECQVLMGLIEGDFAADLHAAAVGNLGQQSFTLRDAAGACVVMAADGYPGPVEPGGLIEGVEAARASPHARVFIAGARRDADGGWRAAGGRVLNVVGEGASVAQAVAHAYDAASLISWPDGFYRRDIGWRALSRPLTEQA